MEKSKKLALSKETLLSLDDQDLAGVAGGTVGVDTVLCNSGVCDSGIACDSVLCGGVQVGL